MRRALLVCALVASPAWAEPTDGGATVTVSVETNGDSVVDVRRGTLKVKAGGVETRVGAGETLRARKGKLPKKLLPAIAPSTPADGATLGIRDVAFAWAKVAGAVHYVIEVSSVPELSAGQTQTIDGTHAVVHLEPGTWYWRVVALDGDGSSGKLAVPRRLTIDTTPPKLKTGKPDWR